MNDAVSKICRFYAMYRITDLAENKLYIERSLQSIAILPRNKKIRVLDVGCGNAFNTALIRAVLPKATVYGVDTATAYRSVWNKLQKTLPGIMFFGNDATELGFADGMFDAVVMWGVLEHIGEGKERLKKEMLRKKAVSEMYRVLKKGGQLMIHYLPNRYGLSHFLYKVLGLPHHENTFNRNQIYGLLEESGFRIRSCSYRHLIPAYPLFGGKLYRRVISGHHALVSGADRLLLRTPLRIFAQDMEIIARK